MVLGLLVAGASFVSDRVWQVQSIRASAVIVKAIFSFFKALMLIRGEQSRDVKYWK